MTSNGLAPQAELSFGEMAPFYDAFTAHHNYEAWLDALLPPLVANGLSGSRLLDVGCGTGKSFLPMLERGWQVVGCDVSEAMVERAREKVDDATQLEVADMRALPRLGEFDLVWALDDAVNYLADVEELSAAFAAMARNLAPGGLLLFDVNTLQTYRTFYVDTVLVEHGDLRLRWHGLSSPTAPPGSQFEACFEVERVDDGRLISAAAHRQRHFQPDDVLRALQEAGLRCLDVFGHGFDSVLERLDETLHMKAIFIACSTDSA